LCSYKGACVWTLIVIKPKCGPFSPLLLTFFNLCYILAKMTNQSDIYREIKTWCARERISWQWITKYPQDLFEDIQLLRKTRTQCWHTWSKHHRGVWAGIWGVTTKKKRRISQKNLTKLEQAVQTAHTIQHTIKAHRHQVTNGNMI